MTKKSIDTDERYTPRESLERVAEAFGGSIDLDPCCGPLAPRGHAKIYCDGVKFDGLRVPWEGNVFVNPPYSRGMLLAWAAKSFAESLVSKTTVVCMLLPQDHSTRAGQFVLRTASLLVYPKGRIAFGSPNGSLKTGAKQPSMFAFWGSPKKPEVLGEVVKLGVRR